MDWNSDGANKSAEPNADICVRLGMSWKLAFGYMIDAVGAAGACTTAASTSATSCDAERPLVSDTNFSPSSFMSAAALYAGVCCG